MQRPFLFPYLARFARLFLFFHCDVTRHRSHLHFLFFTRSLSLTVRSPRPSCPILFKHFPFATHIYLLQFRAARLVFCFYNVYYILYAHILPCLLSPLPPCSFAIPSSLSPLTLSKCKQILIVKSVRLQGPFGQ